MKGFENYDNTHSVNTIKQEILSGIKRYQNSYNVSLLKAAQDSASDLYYFSKGHNYTSALKYEYKERVFRIFTENVLNFSDSEQYAIHFYYDKMPLLSAEEYNDLEKKVADSLAAWNVYRDQLLKNTEEIRRILADSSVEPISNNEIQKYIEYWQVFHQESLPESVLFRNLYKLGYALGKQSKQNCN